MNEQRSFFWKDHHEQEIEWVKDELHGTLLFIGLGKEQCPYTTAETDQPQRKLNEEPKEGSLDSNALCQTLPSTFEMSKATEKIQCNGYERMTENWSEQKDQQNALLESIQAIREKGES